MKVIILLIILQCCSCSSTIVYAPKTVYVRGTDNETLIQGSDLKGNDLKQEGKAKFKIPWLTP